MHKFKEAVNLILLWLILAAPIVAAEKGFMLAEYKSGGLQIIKAQNKNLLSPVGSLLKPFAAWYLIENGLSPTHTTFCPSVKNREGNLRCWTDAGHGAIDIASSLAQSCNYFYLSQFRGRNLKDYETWLRSRFDWPDSLAIKEPKHVYGFDLATGIESEKLMRMYEKLIKSAEDRRSPAAIITRGLAGVCDGTLADFCKKFSKASAFSLIFGKTGTVREGKKNFGAAMLYVEHKPTQRKLLLLCYEKNKMGSEAAMRALRILNEYPQ